MNNTMHTPGQCIGLMTDHEYDATICSHCDGTGEGVADGCNCIVCHGTGLNKPVEDDCDDCDDFDYCDALGGSYGS